MTSAYSSSKNLGRNRLVDAAQAIWHWRKLLNKNFVLGRAAGKFAGIDHHGSVTGDATLIIVHFMRKQVIVAEVTINLADIFSPKLSALNPLITTSSQWLTAITKIIIIQTSFTSSFQFYHFSVFKTGTASNNFLYRHV